VSKGWGGVENMSHIPGEVGASAVQNVGAYGVEAKDVIHSVQVLDVKTFDEHTFTNAECHYSYRKSIFKEALKGLYIITSVTFRLQKEPVFRLDYGNLISQTGENPTLATVREAVINIRRLKLPDPEEIGSAGSFFINPIVDEESYKVLKTEYSQMPSYPLQGGKIKLSAAWLIDHAGWHGKSIGGASVYPKQCLVIVNNNNATAGDVTALAEAIRKSVYEKYRVDITPEVNYI
ncbi:MAG: UDP-N-acetylmuramate dehydrogenase, partial [Bacteroidales bacterium]